EFRRLFEGEPYHHRSSTQGDLIAAQLYEDLLRLGRGHALIEAITSRQKVVNVQNVRVGVRARRGDGTFGELIPNEVALAAPGFEVARGRIATMEIGVEVKVLLKAMIKQIDRVIGDLDRQVTHFKRKGGQPICVGLVGINAAASAVGYEGDRRYATDGRKNKHPFQEAAEAERRLIDHAAPAFGEFLVLRFRATNAAPFPFEWVDESRAQREYGALLTRISREYGRRFA
ncbi:MAG: hypothetical protein ACRDF0_09165, partial [Candidatus Limnocylindria bacterium]